MTAPAINPAAIDAALPDFDADVPCEFRDECERPAVWRVVAHGVADEDETCSVRPYLMCDTCLAEMRALIEQTLRVEGYCESCGKTFRQVSDIIRSVVAL
ncbi:hypothetical protein SEA_JUJU_63 [Gordonia phage JuJu]|uniref:Uncharacterized protein n=1 Tax=Gordonia phage JuJu TaxID=2590929 RepID=A0A516KR62_9CAUD|nr:tail fiber protein [Gordonia phage JuJu]QDP44179.1 hypothetical protein SEA_JUJU_63 [Gordonia phage JuJu]